MQKAAAFAAAFWVEKEHGMTADQPNIVVCPGCGAENTEGADTCEQCQTDLVNLRALANDDPLAVALSSLRLSKPLIVQRSGTVRNAVELLARDPGSAVVVVDGVDIVGIFTERDVLTRVAGQENLLDAPIVDHMTPDPVLLRDSDTIAVALNKMGSGGFRHIPLVEDGQIVAIVTVRDVITWMMSSYFD